VYVFRLNWQLWSQVCKTPVNWQKEWVAVDLHVYNIYGPSLDAPPTVFVRMEGGEQLGELPAELADKIIPDNLTFGEFESEGRTQALGINVDAKPLGIGPGMAHTYSWNRENGTSKGYSEVHPLRWQLITTSWNASQLGEGSFRRGLVLFKSPQAKPITKDSAATLVLRTPFYQEFAHLEYKGSPSPEKEVVVPGSVLGAMRYHDAQYQK